MSYCSIALEMQSRLDGGLEKSSADGGLVIAGFFTGGALAIRGGMKAARNSAIGWYDSIPPSYFSKVLSYSQVGRDVVLLFWVEPHD